MTTPSLYERHDLESLSDYSALINGFREHADRIHYVMSEIRRLHPNSLLDLGCNRGLFGAMCRWSQHGVKRVVGVDWSKPACDAAVEMNQYDQAFCLDLCKDFDLGERFDLVLCMEVLEHVTDPKTVVRNAILHGRYVLFSCPVEDGEVDGQMHIRHVSVDDMRRWANAAGGNRSRAHFLPSEFCEKPHWQGWNFLLVEGKG